MTRSFLFLNVLLVLLLGISIFSFRHSMNPPSIPMQNEHTPDAFMSDAVLKRLDQNGNCQTFIQSPSLTHYADQKTSYLSQPHLIIKKNTSNWHIIADRGKSSHGTDIITFSGHVKVTQEFINSNKPPVKFFTTTLTYFTKRNYVMTNERITIQQPGVTLEATGLRGDLNTGNIQLLSKARGIYDPKTSH